MKFSREQIEQLIPITKMKRGHMKTIAMHKIAKQWGLKIQQIGTKVSDLKTASLTNSIVNVAQEVTVEPYTKATINRTERTITLAIPDGVKQLEIKY